MTSITKEELKNFFHAVSPKVLKLASEKFKKSAIIKFKGSDENTSNYVTDADLDIENKIVEEIRKRFPKDKIVSEENYAAVRVENKGRFWIIDPICGTSNFVKEIKLFATNIAFAENGKLTAACVIDHARNQYIWSVGKEKIFIGETKVNTVKKSSGISIEVDIGGATGGTREKKIRFSQFLSRIIQETNYAPLTYNSSLGFAYAAIGRLDAYISANNKIWDVAAANFLMMTTRGIITTFEGTPWSLESTDVVATKDKKLHKKLLSFLKN